MMTSAYVRKLHKYNITNDDISVHTRIYPYTTTDTIKIRAVSFCNTKYWGVRVCCALWQSLLIHFNIEITVS